MLHRRQAPGRDIHKHFSLVPARGHTMAGSSKVSASSKASATTHSEQTQTVKGRRGEGSDTQCMRTLPPAPRPPVDRRNSKQRSKRKQQSKRHNTQRADTDGEGQKRGGKWYAVHAHAAPPPRPPVYRRNSKQRGKRKQQSKCHNTQRADTDGEGQKRGGQRHALHAHAAPPSTPACAPPRKIMTHMTTAKTAAWNIILDYA